MKKLHDLKGYTYGVFTGEQLREDNGSGCCMIGSDSRKPNYRVRRKTLYLVSMPPTHVSFERSGSVVVVRPARKGEAFLSRAELKQHLMRYGV